MSKGLEEVLDPPVEDLPEELDLVDYLPRGYLSVSQASVFLKCPHQWYLRYVEKKPTKPSVRLLEGVNVHKAVETVLAKKAETGTLPPLDLALDSYSDAFETTKDLIEDWEDTNPGKAKDLGVSITKIHYRDAAPSATPIAVEKAFHVKVNGLPLVGRIDSIQVAIDNPKDFNPEEAKKAPRVLHRIHDLKVTMDKWSKADIKNDLQCATYAYTQGIPDVTIDAIVKGRGKTPSPHYVPTSEVITPKEATHALDVLNGVAQQIAAGVFPKTDPSNWHCSEKFCPVWKHCRGKA